MAFQSPLVGLKNLLKILAAFWKADFQKLSYFYFFLFLTSCCCLNYYFLFDDQYLEPMAGSWQGILGYLGFYGLAYFGMAIPLFAIRKRVDLIQNPRFWLLSCAFILFISVEGGIAIKEEWLEKIVFSSNTGYWRRTLRQWESILVWIPVYFIFQKRIQADLKDGLYGIRFRSEDFKPYLFMLWVMIPLVTLASFTGDFQDYYPVFKRVLPYLPGENNVEKLSFLGAYEASYLLSFTNTELMFRGALVIGMSQVLGHHCVLPMVSVYMFLHFGKPMGEAISSVFGGYILGVLAFQNRNIWGGIFIHTCVAFLMDLAAGLQLWEELKGYL